MKIKNSFGNHLLRVSDMGETALPGQTLIELLNTERVIVENHKGVCLYSKEQVCIRACFGTVLITGNCLEIAKMSKEQLVVMGIIDAVTLERICGS